MGLDAALQSDKFRVRLGLLLGEVKALLDVGIGQGTRGDLFGALVKVWRMRWVRWLRG